MSSASPKSEDELSAEIAAAAANATGLAIEGGGTRPIGNQVAASRHLKTGGIKGITLYEPGALTIVAKAGTTLEELENALAKENQQFPFEPPDYSGLFETKGKSTIGGVVATGASGPRRLQAGGARDSLIGVRFVSGEGEIIKNGGRVMKNVTGYDLVKLLCGSHGTLGVLTEVSFKVLPRPEMTGVVMVRGLEDQAAIEAMARASSSPFDISGAAHLTSGPHGEPLTMIRVEGFAESIRYRTGRLKELLGKQVPQTAMIDIELDQERAVSAFRSVRDVEAFHGSNGAVWRLSLKAGDGARTTSGIAQKMPVTPIYDWAGGLVWLLLEEGQGGAEAVIRGAVNEVGGHATLFRRDPSVMETIATFHPEHPRIEEISHNLRRQFDPAGILNPGRMSACGVRLREGA